MLSPGVWILSGQPPGREKQLYLVVVTGFGKEPLMWLRNVPMRKNHEVLWQVVAGYL